MDVFVELMIDKTGGGIDKEIIMDLLEDFGLYPNFAIDTIVALGTVLINTASTLTKGVVAIVKYACSPIYGTLSYIGGLIASVARKVMSIASALLGKNGVLITAACWATLAVIAEQVIASSIRFIAGETIGSAMSAVPKLIGTAATWYSQGMIAGTCLFAPFNMLARSIWLKNDKPKFFTLPNKVSDDFTKQRRTLDRLTNKATSEFTTFLGLASLRYAGSIVDTLTPSSAYTVPFLGTSLRLGQYYAGSIVDTLTPSICGYAVPFLGPASLGLISTALGTMSFIGAWKLMTARLMVPVYPDLPNDASIQEIFSAVVQAGHLNRKIRDRSLPNFVKAVNARDGVGNGPNHAELVAVAQRQQELTAGRLQAAQAPNNQVKVILENTLQNLPANDAGRPNLEQLIREQDEALENYNRLQNEANVANGQLNQARAAQQAAINNPVKIGRKSAADIRQEMVKRVSILTVAYLIRKMDVNTFNTKMNLNLDNQMKANLRTAATILNGSAPNLSQKQKTVFYSRDLERKAEKHTIQNGILGQETSVLNILAAVAEQIRNQPEYVTIIENSVRTFATANI